MAKHRRNKQNARNAAVASAAVVGAAAALAPAAQAFEITEPFTGQSVQVPGVDALNTGNITNLVEAPFAQQGIDLGLGSLAAAPVSAPLSSEGQKIVDAARTKIGSPYVWGAAGPNAFDCSGLTSWAYSQVGKSIPRTSYDQAAAGRKVSRDQLQPGDIVAFYSGASHVGIYTGHGTVIHALNEGTPLSESPLDSMPYHSAVRF
ncbi:C40 family peptidase [Corynebacterium pelargi]|uniref:Putative endopeptidase n=1 Tax=Corynebacterium pelargi TaxID=1471400 RepID=A0A410W7T8_9CORY|nr:C40 family peptidase [Corynebacterium pelargi]QAU52014.1 putative endopeptidase precursor [Corynebacterium pelargi]GGG70806.1 putative endopeptidase Cgl2188 [Corynebacterium pelargi]